MSDIHSLLPVFLVFLWVSDIINSINSQTFNFSGDDQTLLLLNSSCFLLSKFQGFFF